MSTDAQVQQTADAIRRIVAEIARLAGADVPRQAFFAEFIARAVRAIDAEGGAVWIGREGRFNLIADVRLASSQFTTNPRQRDAVRAALRWVQEHGRSLIVAPMGPDWPEDQDAAGIPNHTPMPFFYVPVKVGADVVGVVQVWQRPGRDPKTFRAFVEFLIQVALYAESYLESRQLETVVRETQRLEQLLLLTERLASSDSADAMALQVVNLGRELVSTDRLTLLTADDGRCRALAVSGQARVERRSGTVQAIEDLARAALATGDARAFRRPEAGKDVPEVVQRFFAESPYDVAALLPLRHAERIVGVLAAEYAAADGRPSDGDLAALESLARQAGPALGRRIETDGLPLRRTARVLAHLRPKRRGRVVLAVVAAAILLAAIVPVRTDVEGRCTVWPTERAVVVAHEPGRIAEVLVDEGARVEAGQPLVRLESPTLSTGLEIARREVDKWRAEAQRQEAAGDPSAAQIAAIRAEKAEGEVAMLQSRIADLTLRAPIAGTVITPDPRSRLGDVLERGGTILNVADLARWEVVVEVPESDIIAVERAVAAANDALGARAEFILASQRDKVLRARLPMAAPAAAARPSAGKNVFLIHGVVDENDLDDVELRVGYEGRARIRTQPKSLLRAAVDPFVDYLRMATF